MATLGFAYNPTKPDAMDLRDRALAWCAANGAQALGDRIEGEPRSWSRDWPDTDCLIVLGGDGTFLRATRALARVDVPVLGVNSGRVGFLSKIEPEALEPTLAELVDGRLHDRVAHDARGGTLERGAGGASVGPFAALNDAAIVRGAAVRVLHLEVVIDGTHLATYVADGVVVATPTGSTAYSFSAGGPILDPTARNLIVTPIAAYLSSIRSIVVGPAHEVRVRLIDGPPCLVSIDGRDDYPLEVGER